MALGVFQSMYDFKVFPDRISFNSTMRAFAKDGQWQLSLSLLHDMKNEETLGRNKRKQHLCIVVVENFVEGHAPL